MSGKSRGEKYDAPNDNAAENDAPFSTEWFQRTIVGFIDRDTGWSTKKLECPKCGKHGEVKPQ